MRARLALAVAASIAVIAAAPFVGQVRAAVQQAMPGRYVAILAAAVAAAVAVALAAAVWRIRDRRALRYGALAAAVAVAAAYATLTRSGMNHCTHSSAAPTRTAASSGSANVVRSSRSRHTR